MWCFAWPPVQAASPYTLTHARRSNHTEHGRTWKLKHKQNCTPTQIIWQCISVECNLNMWDMNQHLCANVFVDLSVGLSTVKPNNFFIQDLCTSCTWSTMASWNENTKEKRAYVIDSVCMRGKMYTFHRWPHVSPHLPMRNRWPHSQHPTTANQIPQIFCCSFRSRVSGRSAACAEGEEDGTGLGGASSGTLMKQNKLLYAQYQTAWEKKSPCRCHAVVT